MSTVFWPAKARCRAALPCLACLLLLVGLAPPVGLADDTAGGEAEDYQARGQVLDPAGNPVVGAEVLAVTAPGERLAATRSDARGQFQLRFDKSAAAVPRLGLDWRRAQLVAKAPDLGAGWVQLGRLEPDTQPVLQLVEDHPIRGRILDLEGRPVAGAELRVLTLYRNDEQNLDGFLKTMRDQPFRIWQYAQQEMYPLSAGALMHSADTPAKAEAGPLLVTTDAEGRFELSGVGRERVVRLELKGPAIESALLGPILTRPEIEPKWRRQPSDGDRVTRMELQLGSVPETIYPATFNYFAPPSRPITGIVRDSETGEPLKGIRVAGGTRTSHATAETDAEGRYVLEGVAVEGVASLRVYEVPPGMPYVLVRRSGIQLSTASAPNPEETDFELVRGITVRGRLSEEESGRPITGSVEYLAYSDNPYVQELPDTLGHAWVEVRDGRFEITALPGPGFIGAHAVEKRYEVADVQDFGRAPDELGSFSTINRGKLKPDEFHAVAAIDPQPDAAPLELDLVVRSGRTIAGVLVDAEGRPVRGVEAEGISSRRAGKQKLDGAEFRVTGLRPGEERRMIFRHPARKLGALVTLSGDEPDTLTVRMQPLATLTGRIVDDQGRPIPGVLIGVVTEGATQWVRTSEQPIPPGLPPAELTERELAATTDADGYFRTTAVLAGVKGELVAMEADVADALGKERFPTRIPAPLATFTLRSGETRDLGDLKLKYTDVEEPQAEGQR